MPSIPLLSAPDNVATATLPASARASQAPAGSRAATISPVLRPTVRANTDMYAGLAAAGQRIGEGIGAWGDLGVRIKGAMDYAAVTKANTTMQAAYQRFQTELEDPSNPENGDVTTWMPRWQERMTGLKESLNDDPAVKAISPAAKLRLDTQMSDWEKLSATQLNHQATVRQLENAKGTVEADYNAKLRTGDLEGAIKTVTDAVPFGIIHQAEAQQLIASAGRKAEHYQATALIMQDPIAAEGALTDRDKDGKPTTFTKLDDDSRLQLTFEAHRRAVQLRSEVAADLFERSQAGTPAPADEVNELVRQGRLTPAQAKQYLKPPKPEFEPTKFASIINDISSYDPAKDANRTQYAALMARAAYDADLKGPAAADAVELLKKKLDPKNPLNSPVSRDAVAAVDDAFKKGLYGKFEVTLPPTAENGYTATKKLDPKIYAQAQQEKMKNLDAVNRYIEANPNATRAEVFKFISGLHEEAIATQGAKLFQK